MRLIDVEYNSNSEPVSVTCEEEHDGTVHEFEVVRHGEWIYFHAAPEGWKVCSECLEQAHHPAGGDPYCHKCGAKMDKGG